MKIAITAMGETPESPVDPRFGRARYFVLHDTKDGTFTAHRNAQDTEAAHGAGIQSATRVGALGAEAVLTGHCGPKAFRALAAGGIPVYEGVTGTVREAARAFLAGALEPSDSPGVEAGFGSV